jgi:hypothetical protein
VDNVRRLQEWYWSYCDGDWEHLYGVKIDTMDNPGWSITISLIGTKNENLGFDRMKIERTDDDWIHAWVDGNVFNVACGALNLDESLGVFLAWAKTK